MTSQGGRARYHPFYCEENVWWACQADGEPLSGHYALMVSNPARQVAMWAQRLAAPGAAVVWDYHVVALARGERGIRVYDPGCGLPLGASLRSWLRASWPALSLTPPALRPRFRVLPAAEYVRELTTDRSHMRDAEGRYFAPPPPWPPPGAGRAPNLMALLDTERDGWGERLPSVAALRRWAASGDPAPPARR